MDLKRQKKLSQEILAWPKLILGDMPVKIIKRKK